MRNKTISELGLLRLAVGLIGEQPKAGWWPSKFCGRESEMFLSPVFPRTVFLARLEGVTASARKAHDEHIGVGRVYHLFRLPAELEEQIHGAFLGEGATVVAEWLGNSDKALEFLRGLATDIPFAPGPVQVGKAADMSREVVWKNVAAYYLNAFERGERTYPYFVEK